MERNTRAGQRQSPSSFHNFCNTRVIFRVKNENFNSYTSVLSSLGYTCDLYLLSRCETIVDRTVRYRIMSTDRNHRHGGNKLIEPSCAIIVPIILHTYS